MKYHPLTFPADSQAHCSVVEWWYFNGHLYDKAGNPYSFMNCLFKVDAWRAKIPYIKQLPGHDYYFAHCLLCDINAQKTYKSVHHVSLVSRDSFKKPFMYVRFFNPFDIRGFRGSEIKETSLHNFHLKADNFSLDLHSRKEPLMEGGRGFAKACHRETFYYSLTDMETKGLIFIKDKKIEVEGRAWMDHVWSDVSFVHDKWTWFAFQLDNGTDIMCMEYDINGQKDYFVDMIHADGRQEHFRHCIMRPGKELWESKNTKASYPLNWQIEIPDKNMIIDAKSLMFDQEMIFGAINYWECPLKVSASYKGEKIKGNGFMELAGYPSDYNFPLLVARKIFKEAQSLIKSAAGKLFNFFPKRRD
jgi:predicted secreted hydrolase